MVIKNFNELSLSELYSILKLRQDVFVREQDCIFEDIDLKDQDAIHLLQKEGDILHAYARLLFEEDKITISRIVTPLHLRDQGIGKAFILKIIDYVRENYSTFRIRIDAQTRLEKFYEKLGFKTVGPEFYFEGDPILHVPMELEF
ncbi:GNAT family N-acetyltransferase [Candidatus Bealeia paramacronuclearis]|uniref:GNAT family N-acetyltransferase n=1 Tax=Candidatus Bealeia paramacronuclearis TaxID=1921001 RepID=A0ABZ2C1G4_9PROT|nr:GNAT family N-acetyltransferase [Candidatus Bealeia paramacronuclearis]